MLEMSVRDVPCIACHTASLNGTFIHGSFGYTLIHNANRWTMHVATVLCIKNLTHIHVNSKKKSWQWKHLVKYLVNYIL
jgi:hypothetical protein